MPYELAPREPAGAAARRLIGDEIDAVVAQLRSAGPADRATAIHDTRKGIKRARTVLRLFRAVLGDEVFGRENAALGAAAGHLSATRDSDVCPATLTALGPGLPARTRARARAFLAKQKATTRSEPDRVARVVADLTVARARIADQREGEDGFDPLAAGLEAVYRKGRAAMRLALSEPTAERFHDWRKQSKHLWHVLALLDPLWPRVIASLAKEAHALADLLGDDHDLEVLGAVLLAEETPLTPHDRAVVSAALADRSRDLRERAARLGALLYCDRPAVFVDRIHAWWRVWTRQG